MTRPLPLAVLLCLAGLFLAGCTSSRSADSAPASETPASTPSSTRTTPSPPPAPRQDECYPLTAAELTQAASTADPVACARRHTSRTIFVGRLDTVVQGHSLDVTSPAVQRQMARTCPAKLADFLGGSTRVRALSRFEVVWFSPTTAEADQGADWFRCDVAAFSGSDTLLSLPDVLRGALDRPGALDRFGLCGTAEPGTSGFRRIICARKHSWQAIDTLALSGRRGAPSSYPGEKAVRSKGEPFCKAAARTRAEDKLTFRYGWEWPTAAQWKSGQHYGFCWVPSA